MSISLDRRRAVIVDQHPLWLDSVEKVLALVNVEVVGRATSSSTALDLLLDLKPEVLVTGIAMSNGDPDGITLVRETRERLPGLKAIVLSMYDDAKHIEEALAAGAVAYVLKSAHPDDLASALRQVFEHSVYMAGPVPPARPARVVSDDSPALTRRELEILQLVAEGHSNAELARMLWVTEQTIKFHLSNIYRKLEVANRTEASRWAQLRGLLAQPAMA